MIKKKPSLSCKKAFELTITLHDQQQSLKKIPWHDQLQNNNGGKGSPTEIDTSEDKQN